MSEDNLTEPDESELSIYFRPTYRGQMQRLLSIMMLTGIGVYLGDLYNITGVYSLYHWIYRNFNLVFNWDDFLLLSRAVIVFIALIIFMKAAVFKHSHRYFIGPKGVESKIGIFGFKEMRIEFSHIRGVHLNQPFFQRLLGFGTIKIPTSGTDDDEIEFINISNPERILGILKSRMRDI